MEIPKIEQKIKILTALIVENESRGDPYRAITQLKEDIEICKLAILGIKYLEVRTSIDESFR